MQAGSPAFRFKRYEKDSDNYFLTDEQIERLRPEKQAKKETREALGMEVSVEVETGELAMKMIDELDKLLSKWKRDEAPDSLVRSILLQYGLTGFMTAHDLSLGDVLELVSNLYHPIKAELTSGNDSSESGESIEDAIKSEDSREW